LKFFKSSESIKKKLLQNIEKLKSELEQKQKEYQELFHPDVKTTDAGQKSEREFFSRIFDPSDEYMQVLKESMENLSKKINKFELIIRNIPRDAKRIELSLEELEEFGF